jgi:hypothetical protein
MKRIRKVLRFIRDGYWMWVFISAFLGFLTFISLPDTSRIIGSVFVFLTTSMFWPMTIFLFNIALKRYSKGCATKKE